MLEELGDARCERRALRERNLVHDCDESLEFVGLVKGSEGALRLGRHLGERANGQPVIALDLALIAHVLGRGNGDATDIAMKARVTLV